MERICFYGPRACQANRELLDFCRTTKPDLVWVDKSTWIWPKTLRVLREFPAFLVHHFTDALYPRDMLMRWSFHLLRRSLPLYHMNFTSNIDDVKMIQASGAATIDLTYLAYDHTRFTSDPLPEGDRERWDAGVLFVGHHEKRTERYLRALLDAGLPTTVYGWGWGKTALARRYPEAVGRRTLTDEEYVKAIKAARIGLCCVSELNYNQTAARSYEIPASGTFLLAMRTPQHQESYEEGKEAEFFSTPEECVEKARYFLEHPEERSAIAKAGHTRCTASEYSWARYMRDDWAKVREAFTQWSTPRAG
jgi:hypothetical protein